VRPIRDKKGGETTDHVFFRGREVGARAPGEIKLRGIRSILEERGGAQLLKRRRRVEILSYKKRKKKKEMWVHGKNCLTYSARRDRKRKQPEKKRPALNKKRGKLTCGFSKKKRKMPLIFCGAKGERKGPVGLKGGRRRMVRGQIIFIYAEGEVAQTWAPIGTGGGGGGVYNPKEEKKTGQYD